MKSDWIKWLEYKARVYFKSYISRESKKDNKNLEKLHIQLKTLSLISKQDLSQKKTFIYLSILIFWLLISYCLTTLNHDTEITIHVQCINIFSSTSDMLNYCLYTHNFVQLNYTCGIGIDNFTINPWYQIKVHFAACGKQLLS